MKQESFFLSEIKSFHCCVLRLVKICFIDPGHLPWILYGSLDKKKIVPLYKECIYTSYSKEHYTQYFSVLFISIMGMLLSLCLYGSI